MGESTPGIGHNSGAAIAPSMLKSIVERVEKLEEEKSELATDVREVYAEAKGNGFDTKTIRRIVRLRAMEAQARREQKQLLETYAGAIGEDDIFM